MNEYINRWLDGETHEWRNGFRNEKKKWKYVLIRLTKFNEEMKMSKQKKNRKIIEKHFKTTENRNNYQ